jgi:hypothetical protein
MTDCIDVETASALRCPPWCVLRRGHVAEEFQDRLTSVTLHEGREAVVTVSDAETPGRRARVRVSLVLYVECDPHTNVITMDGEPAVRILGMPEFVRADDVGRLPGSCGEAGPPGGRHPMAETVTCAAGGSAGPTDGFRGWFGRTRPCRRRLVGIAAGAAVWLALELVACPGVLASASSRAVDEQ